MHNYWIKGQNDVLLFADLYRYLETNILDAECSVYYVVAYRNSDWEDKSYNQKDPICYFECKGYKLNKCLVGHEKHIIMQSLSSAWKPTTTDPFPKNYWHHLQSDIWQ